MRKGRCPCSLLIFLGLCSIEYGQQELRGKIRKKGSSEILIAVTIANHHQAKFNTSDLGGNYRIPAAAGDSIIFSSAGYLPDTVVVSVPMLDVDYAVYLTPYVVTLSAVRVGELSNYQIDSLQRRNDYKNVLDKKHPVKLWNEKRPGDEPGFNFSPVGFFPKPKNKNAD